MELRTTAVTLLPLLDIRLQGVSCKKRDVSNDAGQSTLSVLIYFIQ